MKTETKPKLIHPPHPPRKTDHRNPSEVNTSLIPQVNDSEGPTITKPDRPPRTLLTIPTQRNLPPPPPTHPTKCPTPEPTEHPPHRTTRAPCSPKEAKTDTLRQPNPTAHPRTHPNLQENESGYHPRKGGVTTVRSSKSAPRTGSTHL